jgi:hypothetical protein
VPTSRLVLQFRGRAIEDADEVAEVEDALFEMLADGEALDGHDISATARNVYVLTEDPAGAYRRFEPFLARAGLADGLVAAYLPPAADAYTILWPHAPAAPFSLE